MTDLISPTEALFAATGQQKTLRVCEHYAGKESYIRKAFELQEELGDVFDLTCDLEDGAERGAEAAHLEMILDLLRSKKFSQRPVGLRVHDVLFPAWKSELQSIARAVGDRLSYVTIPKLKDFAEARAAVFEVQIIFAEHSRRAKEIPIHLLIETHGALQDVWKIAALGSVESLDFGHMDFISAHGGAIAADAMRSPMQFEHALLRRAKAEICAAALAHHIVPTHNVTIDYKNSAQAGLDAARAKSEFGFQRMWSIHPGQIQPIVEALRPDHSEIKEAEAILLTAQQAHWGPISYQDRLYDRASYRLLWLTLERGYLSGAKISEAAEKAFFSRGK